MPPTDTSLRDSKELRAMSKIIRTLSGGHTSDQEAFLSAAHSYFEHLYASGRYDGMRQVADALNDAVNAHKSVMTLGVKVPPAEAVMSLAQKRAQDETWGGVLL